MEQYSGILLLLGFLAIFYFLIIRPQRVYKINEKKVQNHELKRNYEWYNSSDSNTFDTHRRIDCPYCQSTLNIEGDGNWICSRCDNHFVYYQKAYKAEEIQTIEAIYSSIIFAKFSKANGVVTKEDLRIISEKLEDTFGANPEQMKQFKKIVNTESKNASNWEIYIERLYEQVKNESNLTRETAEFLLDTMFNISLQGGGSDEIHNEQNKMILKIAHIFNIDSTTYELVKNKYITQINQYYVVLDLKKGASLEEIKRQYKKLCKKYHPDVYSSKDLPEEIINLATGKFREINEAYEILMNSLS